MRQEARISTLHIRILPSQEGTQPLQVVNSAKLEFEKTKQFEKVFAVFDRDDHTTYANAIARAEALNGKLEDATTACCIWSDRLLFSSKIDA